jgi:hypothetical protein
MPIDCRPRCGDVHVVGAGVDVVVDVAVRTTSTTTSD